MRVSVDVLYLKINEVLEYNPPYVQSDFAYNPDHHDILEAYVQLAWIKGP